MATTIRNLGQAARHDLFLKAECNQCSKAIVFFTGDLASIYGADRDPYDLKFRCQSCESYAVKVVMYPKDFDRNHEVVVWRPVKIKV